MHISLAPSVLLNPFSVEAQETTTTIGIDTIEISNNLTLGNPFYEGTSAKLLSQRVLGTTTGGLPQIELTTIQDASIEGVGNVTNLATWINIYKTAKIVHAVGKGVITTENGEIATWVANDVGRPDDTGVITYRGSFSTPLTLSSSDGGT